MLQVYGKEMCTAQDSIMLRDFKMEEKMQCW